MEGELCDALESHVEICDEQVQIPREKRQRSMNFRFVDAAAALDGLEHLLVVVVARSLDCCHLCDVSTLRGLEGPPRPQKTQKTQKT